MSQPGPRRGRVVIVNIVLVVALLAVLGGTAAWLSAGRSEDTAAALRTVPVGRGLVARTVAASGTVVSATSSSVGFSTGGEVTDVRVGLGDRVAEGQVLATIDDRYARANLQAAQAGLTSARQQLEDAESGTAPAATSSTGTSAGGQSGQAGGTAPSGGQGSSEGQLDQLRSQVAQARATVIDAERSLDGTRLKAPQSGTVVSLDGRVGQTVSGTGTQVTSTGSGSPSVGAPSSGAGAATGGTNGAGPSGGAAPGSSGACGSGAGSASGSAAPGGSAFLSIADLDRLQVEAQLPELDVGQVRDGQSVAVSINALPGRSLPGVVSGINALPGTGASVQYGTTIGLEGRPPGLRLGQSASVAITTGQADAALFLPNAAIEPQGGATTATQGTVLVYAGGRQERRTVGLGIAADTITQITGGLSVGDLVVLPQPAVSSPFEGGRGANGGGPPGGSGAGGGDGADGPGGGG